VLGIWRLPLESGGFRYCYWLLHDYNISGTTLTIIPPLGVKSQAQGARVLKTVPIYNPCGDPVYLVSGNITFSGGSASIVHQGTPKPAADLRNPADSNTNDQ